MFNGSNFGLNCQTKHLSKSQWWTHTTPYKNTNAKNCIIERNGLEINASSNYSIYLPIGIPVLSKLLMMVQLDLIGKEVVDDTNFSDKFV